MLILFFSFFADAAGGSEGPPWSTIFAQVYNAILFVGLIVFFLRPKAKAFFAKRHEDFLEKMNRSQNLKDKVEKQKKEMGAKLLELEKNWEQSFQKVKMEAEQRKKREVLAVEKKAKDITSEAERVVTLEKHNVVLALKKELFEEAMKDVEKRLPEKIDQRKRKELHMEFVEGLKGGA